MKTIEGDLLKLALEGKFDVIVHGCNCYCAMGAGIALSVKKIFPEAYEADKQTSKGDKDKLGSFSSVVVNRGQHSITIVNAYTQFHWKGQGLKADYEAIDKVFSLIGKEFSGQRIAYPLIGAGLAGGDWGVISNLIDNRLDGEQHTLVKYKK